MHVGLGVCAGCHGDRCREHHPEVKCYREIYKVFVCCLNERSCLNGVSDSSVDLTVSDVLKIKSDKIFN